MNKCGGISENGTAILPEKGSWPGSLPTSKSRKRRLFWTLPKHRKSWCLSCSRNWSAYESTQPALRRGCFGFGRRPFKNPCGSVDILATTLRIRNRQFLRIAVCYGGRRCDGRSRTPALRSDRSASLQGGASSLPQPFQQATIHATPVAGHSLPDALRRLDLSRSRGAARRTSRIAAGARTDQRARFHYVVSLLATSGRPDHRPRGGRDRTPVAWSAQKRAVARSRGGRRDRLGARCSQHVFCASPAPSRAKAAAVAALVEVGGGSGFGSTVRVVADRAPRSVERLCQSARCGRNRRAANSHRPGLGRCRVRQRKESYLHPSATRGTKRDPRQAWKENLASTWCPCGDAPGLSVSTLPATRSDRERILLGQTQALGARPWAKPVYASAPSSAARPEFQFVPPEASLPFSEDVNRAKVSLGRTSASMGPRSGERGNLSSPAALNLWRLASMGPRSGERGNVRNVDTSLWPDARFNGAALR